MFFQLIDGQSKKTARWIIYQLTKRNTRIIIIYRQQKANGKDPITDIFQFP